MAYDEKLAGRLDAVLSGRAGITKKKMFGGLAFLLHGNMVCGVLKQDLVVRVGPEADPAALSKPHARPMDFSGRPMKGYVYVAPDGVRTAPSLKGWVEMGLTFVKTLPKK